jgi:hypothetical protein
MQGYEKDMLELHAKAEVSCICGSSSQQSARAA